MRRSIEVTTEVRATLARARVVLVEDPGTVLAATCSAEQRRVRAFVATLSIAIGGGASLQQDVALEAGRPHASDGDLVLPVIWHAKGHERLVPSFDGELVLSGDALHTLLALRGRYAIPLGPLGRFGDGLAGRRIARCSMVGYLEHLARRLDAEVDRRIESAGSHRAPYEVTAEEHDCHSEQFIG